MESHFGFVPSSFISLSYPLEPLLFTISALYTAILSFLRRAYVAVPMHVRSEYVSWKESMELHLHGSERVSPTQSRIVALTRRCEL